MIDDQRVGEVVEKIDELLVILNSVAQDLRDVSGSLKSLVPSKISQPVATPALVKTEVSVKAKAIEDVRMMFPEDLENLLSFEEKEDYVKVQPRQFLGSDNFAKIASIVREMDGDYVSAGKQSHFRVPKTRS